MKIIVKNEKETGEVAKEIVASLKGGEVLALVGELGAGKTTFTQALGKALGAKQKINSPTYVVMKIYNIAYHVSRVDHRVTTIDKLIHIDAYRLNSEDDLVAIGADEHFGDKTCVTVIEWADKIKNMLPKNTKTIYFKSLGKNTREIEF